MKAVEMKEKYERALHDLNDLKNHEADYAVINRLLNIINVFASIGYVNELMAEALAEKTGKTKEEIMEEFSTKAGV